MKTEVGKTNLLIYTFLVTLAATSLFSRTAIAGEINCSGSYIIYPLTVFAKTLGTRVSGVVTVTLYDGTTVLRQASVLTNSSDLQLRKWLRFTGKSNDGGTGELAAYFDGASGAYNGKAVVRSTEGNFEVDVSCQYNEDVRRRKSRIRRH